MHTRPVFRNVFSRLLKSTRYGSPEGVMPARANFLDRTTAVSLETARKKKNTGTGRTSLHGEGGWGEEIALCAENESLGSSTCRA